MSDDKYFSKYLTAKWYLWITTTLMLLFLFFTVLGIRDKRADSVYLCEARYNSNHDKCEEYRKGRFATHQACMRAVIPMCYKDTMEGQASKYSCVDIDEGITFLDCKKDYVKALWYYRLEEDLSY